MARYNIKTMVRIQLKCLKCKKSHEIFRQKSRLKKQGHIKTMQCPHCAKQTDNVELGREEK